MIVFFDGVCGLCNRFVDFVLSIDKKHIFSFAPLQGKTAESLLPSQRREISSILLVIPAKPGIHDVQIYEKSEACLRIFHALGGVWKFFLILKIVPRSLRDFIYDVIARHRYEWFGKRETCRLPTPEEKEFFLD